jgi:uncharacterized protein YkwD
VRKSSFFLAVLAGACGAAEEDAVQFDPTDWERTCGNGELNEGEECDGVELNGLSCVQWDPARPLGDITCTERCRYDFTDCVAFKDSDGDGVRDERDVDPDDEFACRDGDGDGCDDCSLNGEPTPNDDGFDDDGDGFCEQPPPNADADCLTGRNAESDPYRRLACEMFQMINEDRLLFRDTESAGAQPLAWNEDIWEVAVEHSRDMCERGFFAHVNPEGQSPSDRARQAGLDYGLGENIVINFTPAQGQYAFMNEPTCTGHRRNILEARYTEAAVGYIVCEDGRHFGTQNFRLGAPGNDFCNDPRNVCNLPPEPVSAASMREGCRNCSRIDFDHPQFVRYCPNG